MCGIAGLLFAPSDPGEAIVREMTKALAQRGPDAEGYWHHQEAGVYLGHRRLSIIDLTPAGAQPMQSADGRYTISFNGEIYNFQEIREQLQGVAFVGNSDTEVILAAVAEWGLRQSLLRFNGMFAFALWDAEKKELTLARDRIGIKPLYYGWAGKQFIFASEMRALLCHPELDRAIDQEALALYLQQDYIPAPASIFESVKKLKQGRYLTISSQGEIEEKAYWSLADFQDQQISNNTEEELQEELHQLLADSVRLRSIADVPLGTFLSGGIDSPTVAAHLQKQSNLPVKSFSVGFTDKEFDESQRAARIARHLGTEHNELIVRPADLLSVVDKMPTIFSEPFGDPSAIPTYLVSRFARDQVTVCLSGDGGDELFAGYNRYKFGASLWKRYGDGLPGFRNISARILASIPATAIDGLANSLNRYRNEDSQISQAADKVLKVSRALPWESQIDLYHRMTSRLPLRLTSCEPPAHQWFGGSFEQKMMVADLDTYLPDDLLVKMDRASMAVGLEARVPLLDHRLVEFSLRLPMEMKIRNNSSKWILRQELYNSVPEKLMAGPKQGFGVPIGNWLRNELKDWAEEMIKPQMLTEIEGVLPVESVEEIWSEHLSGKQNHQYFLWNVLMFAAWKQSLER
jgi:asparagine synthase (glutamine-hydrolysing)